MIFSELNLSGMLDADDDAFGPETTRGEIPEYLFWSTFCDLLERIEPDGVKPGADRQDATDDRRDAHRRGVRGAGREAPPGHDGAR